MAVVAVSAGIGLAIMGLPNPGALGLLTGLLAFVPGTGPLL